MKTNFKIKQMYFTPSEPWTWLQNSKTTEKFSMYNGLSKILIKQNLKIPLHVIILTKYITCYCTKEKYSGFQNLPKKWTKLVLLTINCAYYGIIKASSYLFNYPTFKLLNYKVLSKKKIGVMFMDIKSDGHIKISLTKSKSQH